MSTDHDAPAAVIVRNGASERTEDELTMQFIYDAVELGAELSATGRQDLKHLTARLANKHDPVSGNAHFEDEADEQLAKHLAEQLETDLATVPREGGSGYVVTWEDGFVIRPSCDHPTCADFDQHQEG